MVIRRAWHLSTQLGKVVNGDPLSQRVPGRSVAPEGALYEVPCWLEGR